MLAALSEKIPYPLSVEVLGVLAARREAQFTVELGIQQSVFERDSEMVCKALKSANCYHSSIGQFVKDVLLVWMEHVLPDISKFVVSDSSAS